MPNNVDVNKLKIHVMPDEVFESYVDNNAINENELYIVEDDTQIVTADGTVVSGNADFAEVGEWVDGNPNEEDRIGYFVCIDHSCPGPYIRKATANDDIRGVTVSAPAFAGNYSGDKLGENEKLLQQYDFVAVIGVVPVIDNGTCEVYSRCMPGDDGTAVPTTSEHGYEVIERIDSTHVLILVEPGTDCHIRLENQIKDLDRRVRSNTLPPVSSQYNDKLLRVIEGAWKFVSIGFMADETGMLNLANGRIDEVPVEIVEGLPAVSTDHDGMFLRVIDGQWKLVTLVLKSDENGVLRLMTGAIYDIPTYQLPNASEVKF